MSIVLSIKACFLISVRMAGVDSSEKLHNSPLDLVLASQLPRKQHFAQVADPDALSPVFDTTLEITWCPCLFVRI